MEGASNDKLFDIQNRCTAAVSLSDYKLVSCGNDCTGWEHTESLGSAVLQPGDVWRIANQQASAAILATANQTHAYLSNGNDVYGLRTIATSAVTDAVGFIAATAVTAWAVAGISTGTKDHTLVRKANVNVGTCGTAAGWHASAGTDAATSEWLVYAKGTIPTRDPSGMAGVPTVSSGSGGGGHPPSPSGGGSQTCPHLQDCPAPASGVAASDGRADKSRLTVATWNAEWLFDGVCDPSASPWGPARTGNECVGYSHHLNQCDAAGARSHWQRAAEVLSRMNADVINMVEVEGCDAIGYCAEVLNNQSVGNNAPLAHYLLTGTDTYLKQQVGLLTRLSPIAPLERSSARSDYPIDTSSNCGTPPHGPGSSDLSKHYLARLKLDIGDGSDATLIILGMHMKAIPTQAYSCNKREAQAVIAQGLLTTALQESPYVIAMGDLNDFDGDACCLDAAGSQPTSRVLRMLKDPRNTGTDELHAVAERVPLAERYTDWWDHQPEDGTDQGVSEHSSLDHMLVSTALFHALASVRTSKNSATAGTVDSTTPTHAHISSPSPPAAHCTQVHIDHTHQPMDV